MAPDGRFAVIWDAGDHGSFENPDIALRRFSTSGIALGPEFVVNSYTTGHQDKGSIGMDAAGNFVVGWQHSYGYEPYAGVWGQRFDADGSRLGANFRADQPGPIAGTEHPFMAVAPTGESLLTWDTRGRIAARLFDSAGAPVGAQFQVNVATSPSSDAFRPSASFDGNGEFVVVWLSGEDTFDNEIQGRRFSSAGVPLGAQFDLPLPDHRIYGSRVARARDGSFVVDWSDGNDVRAQWFDATATPVGTTMMVGTENQFYLFGVPDIALTPDGGFIVVWESLGGILGRRFDRTGNGDPPFTVDTPVNGDWGDFHVSVGADPAGNFVVSWHAQNRASNVDRLFVRRYAGGMLASQASVDAAASPTSDGNGVFEAGETVSVDPLWLNGALTSQVLAGTAVGFTGPGAPGNAAYAIVDSTADYGTVPSNGGASCTSTGDCYALRISAPSSPHTPSRPALHWDTTLVEDVAEPNVLPKRWSVHVGDSFSDVPRSNPFYRFVETLLHNNVTGGCTTTTFCPDAVTTRGDFAALLLLAREGGSYVPAPCTVQAFKDVPMTSPLCPWIQEVVRRGVIVGCGSRNYCPKTPVSREQIAPLLLAMRDPDFAPPACGLPMFTDVPASSPYCASIEELVRRGFVTGCGNGMYCPAKPVSRAQASVFLTGTFGLALYGP